MFYRYFSFCLSDYSCIASQLDNLAYPQDHDSRIHIEYLVLRFNYPNTYITTKEHLLLMINRHHFHIYRCMFSIYFWIYITKLLKINFLLFTWYSLITQIIQNINMKYIIYFKTKIYIINCQIQKHNFNKGTHL